MGLPVLGEVVLSSLCRLVGGRTPRLGAVMGSYRGTPLLLKLNSVSLLFLGPYGPKNMSLHYV